MQVHIGLDDVDKANFFTFRGPGGPYRSLLITINGRPFSTWYQLDDCRRYDEDYLRELDRMLSRQFERMIGRLFDVAIKMVPIDVNLLEASDEEISKALMAVAQDPNIGVVQRSKG